MIGQRQQQIITLLQGGAWSYEALVNRLSPDRAEDRRLIFDALTRLQRAGRVRMTGRRGRHGLTGAMVALAEPGRPDAAT
jgi:hypothetical protein